MTDVLSRRALVVAVLTLPARAAWETLVHAAAVSFKVPITGGQEVPSVQTNGYGIADLTYDPETRVLTWTITYSGLSSPVTMAQFHGPAQPGKNAPGLVSLTKQGGPVESPITGQATLTPEQSRRFAAGDWYINIHTQTHSDGEIRGLVLTPRRERARSGRGGGQRH
jgi:CHRD domain